jgi:hypothetical protein
MTSDTNPTPSPATDEPTLEDLYNALDWSKSEEALRSFYQTSGRSDERENEVFRKRFRCVLLQEALYGEELTVRQAAQYFLCLAGVWDQVASFCKARGLAG